jgi:methylenetetrahydrofolate dehydrogenase (NADP+)/methenyltetrahydrofolate cyclohydrolase
LLDGAKDIEGINPANLGHLLCGTPINIPCTAQAAIECIASTGVPVRGAEVVVVGASEIVGKPAALLLRLRPAAL